MLLPVPTSRGGVVTHKRSTTRSYRAGSSHRQSPTAERCWAGPAFYFSDSLSLSLSIQHSWRYSGSFPSLYATVGLVARPSQSWKLLANRHHVCSSFSTGQDAVYIINRKALAAYFVWDFIPSVTIDQPILNVERRSWRNQKLWYGVVCHCLLALNAWSLSIRRGFYRLSNTFGRIQ